VPKTKKTYSVAIIEKLVREELAAYLAEIAPYGRKSKAQRLGKFLTKDLFAKDPSIAKKEKRLKQEQRVREIFSDIAMSISNAPPDLESKIQLLRDLKERLSHALIWGDEPLLDLISEDDTNEKK
jgi:hypothetical protein